MKNQLLPYLIGGVLSPAMSVIACLFLGYKFWKRAGVWRLLVVFSGIHVGVTIISWTKAFLQSSNFNLGVVDDLTSQLLALVILILFNRTLGKKNLTWYFITGYCVTLAMAILVTHHLAVLRSMTAVYIVLASLLTLLHLYYWTELKDQPIHRTPYFWVLGSFLVQFPSQIAMAHWLDLTVGQGQMSLLWLYYAVSVVPEALASSYLIFATFQG